MFRSLLIESPHFSGLLKTCSNSKIKYYFAFSDAIVWRICLGQQHLHRPSQCHNRQLTLHLLHLPLFIQHLPNPLRFHFFCDGRSPNRNRNFRYRNSPFRRISRGLSFRFFCHFIREWRVSNGVWNFEWLAHDS